MEKDNKKDIEYKPALFQYEPDFFVLYKKIQNLSSGIFLVMDSVSDNPANNLKSSICQETLDCLFELSGSIAGNDPLFEALRRLGAGLLNVNALLEISFWIKQISKNNFEILQTEIQKIYSLANELLSKYASRFALESNFFERGAERQQETPALKGQGQSYKGQKDKRTSPLDISKGLAARDDSQEKINRRKAILDILKQKNNLSVKDISTVVTGYSEKTIQRELVSLMSEGLIIRQGKRRWSTYSLIGR
jgi:DNA-binding transcriptional ArsR family regulator